MCLLIDCLSVVNYGVDKLLTCTATCDNPNGTITWILYKRRLHDHWENYTLVTPLNGRDEKVIDSDYNLKVSLFDDGSLLIPGSLWFSSVRVTCTLYNNNSRTVCDTVQFTLNVLSESINVVILICYSF